MTRKDGKIELLRFLGIVFIMCDHMGHIGLGELNRPFTGTWLYVEFFLILSGFMTAKHFYSVNSQIPGDNKSSIVSNSVKYTVHKYSRFLPYVICAVLIQYLIQYGPFLKEGNLNQFLKNMQEMPFEMLLLSAAGTNGTRLFPIWFLSATFLVSPFIGMIAQIKNDYLKGLIAFYPALFYYLFRLQSIGNHDYPNQIIRAFCGMALGIFVFLMSELIGNKSRSAFIKGLLSVVLVGSFLYLMIIGYKGYAWTSSYLICFILIIMLTFCENTFVPRFSNRVFLFLGKISMPMFIWHIVVAHLQVLVFPNSSTGMRILCYYFGTIIISLISIQLVGMVANARKKNKTLRGSGNS